MSRKARVILVIVVVEVALAALWGWLAQYGLANPGKVTADFQGVVGETMGMAMGAFAGLGLLLFMLAAKNDRIAKFGR